MHVSVPFSTMVALFLSAVFLSLLAVAPFLIAEVGRFWAQAMGCSVDVANLVSCADETLVPTIQSVVDIGFYFPFTLIFAGFPAVGLWLVLLLKKFPVSKLVHR